MAAKSVQSQLTTDCLSDVSIIPGVVARGAQCSGFNNPGIYSRVKKIYDWIKSVVEKEGGNFCSKSGTEGSSSYGVGGKVGLPFVDSDSFDFEKYSDPIANGGGSKKKHLTK